jgi:hypothetical protein
MHIKSQSAMEYLMTYGWAILVVLVVVSGLFALGVFDRNEVIPGGTEGVFTYELKGGSNGVQISLSSSNIVDDGQIVDIKVNGMSCNPDITDIVGGQTNIITCTNFQINLAENEIADVEVDFTYTKQNSQIAHSLNIESNVKNEGTAFIIYPDEIEVGFLELWLDANDESTITKDGSNFVSRWDDKSGNNYYAEQTTGTSQPNWLDDELNQNDIVSFDGDDDWMILPTFAFPGNGVDDHTIFIVFKGDSSNKLDGLFGNIKGNWGQGHGIGIHSSYIKQYSHSGAAGFASSNVPVQNTNYYILTSEFKTDDHKVYFGITEEALTAGSAVNWGGLNSVRIAKIYDSQYDENGNYPGVLSKYAKINVAEIIVYSKVLSELDRNYVVGYLSNKYDIVV